MEKNERAQTLWDCPDRLHPPYFAISRTVTLNAAIISMVTTCLDGTILSIPYVFYKIGLVLSPFCLIIVWLIYSWTLLNLSICVRKLQSVSFSEILFRLYGHRVQIFFSILLFSILFSIILGYFILMKNIFSNLLKQFFAHLFNDKDSGNNSTTNTVSLLLNNHFILLFLLLIPILPLMLIENLERMKFIHFLGFISIFFLIIVMFYILYHDIIDQNYYQNLYPFKNNNDNNDYSSLTFFQRLHIIFSHLKTFPTTLYDVIEGISIIFILYLNHFNFFHLISQLKEPNQDRIMKLIFLPGAILTIVFLLIGILGNVIFLIYWDYALIEDNILLALQSNKYLLSIARIMTLVSLMCTIPNMITPVRLLVYELERYLFREYYYPFLTKKREASSRRSSYSKAVDKEASASDVVVGDVSPEFPTMIIEDWVKKAEIEKKVYQEISEEMDEKREESEDELMDIESRGRANSSGSIFKISRRSSYISSDECEEAEAAELGFHESPRILMDRSCRSSPYSYRPQTSYGSFQQEEERAPLLVRPDAATVVYLTNPCQKSEKRKVSIDLAANRKNDEHEERQLMYLGPEQCNPPKIIQDLTDFGFGGIEATWRQYNLLPIEILSSISEPIKEALEEKCRVEVQRDDDQCGARGIEMKDFYHDQRDRHQESPFKDLILDEEELKAIGKEDISRSLEKDDKDEESERNQRTKNHQEGLHQTMKEKFNFYNKLTITCLIVSIVVVLAAILPPQVSIVWETIGSVITPWIAIVLPSLCFTRLPHFLHVKADAMVYFTWGLAILGFLSFFICSFRVLLSHMF